MMIIIIFIVVVVIVAVFYHNKMELLGFNVVVFFFSLKWFIIFKDEKWCQIRN